MNFSRYAEINYLTLTILLTFKQNMIYKILNNNNTYIKIVSHWINKKYLLVNQIEQIIINLHVS